MTGNTVIRIENATTWQRPKRNDLSTVSEQVATYLEAIKAEGDPYIERMALQFDQAKPKVIQLKAFEDYDLDEELVNAIRVAAERIETFAQFQLKQLGSGSFSDSYGSYEQILNPIERVGCYIPGGRFPLISTALMTLIPAKVAGSHVRIACSPSSNPALLAAASLAGATEFVQLGGVQAIGAMAYGSQLFADTQGVDLIVGPGNAWVNEAKRQLQGVVKIDGLAGPSELMALCDNKQPVEWLVADALAQAEHDPDAQSILVSDSPSWLTEVAEFIEANAKVNVSYADLLDNQQIVLLQVADTAELIKVSETYAAEHLMLCHGQVSAEQLSQYGSLFVGSNSAVALGDYISGPNHTLPTATNARQTGGLNVTTFIKIQTVQTISDTGRVNLSRLAVPIANAEGLTHHAASLQIRTN